MREKEYEKHFYKLRMEGFKIKEIPTVWQDKFGSTLNFARTPFEVFGLIIKLRLYYSPFRIFWR
jgi:hypothetical protein